MMRLVRVFDVRERNLIAELWFKGDCMAKKKMTEKQIGEAFISFLKRNAGNVYFNEGEGFELIKKADALFSNQKTTIAAFEVTLEERAMIVDEVSNGYWDDSLKRRILKACGE